MKKLIILILAAFVLTGSSANAAWLFEEKDIYSGDYYHSNEYKVIFYHEGQHKPHPNYRLDLFDYDGSLYREDLGSEDWDRYSALIYWPQATPSPAPTPLPEVQPYAPAADEAVGFVERDGKYAAVNSEGELLSGYVYDEVLHDFDMEEIVPKQVYKTYYFETPHGNPSHSSFEYEICASRVYAMVVQDGQEKYIDTRLNELDVIKDALYDHLENIGSRFAFAYIGYTKDRPDQYVQPIAIYDRAEDRITCALSSDIKVYEVCYDREHFIYRIQDGDNTLYGVMDMYGNKTMEGDKQLWNISCSGYVEVYSGGKYGVSDVYGNVIIEPEYRDVTAAGEGLFAVYKDVWGEVTAILDNTGESIFAYSSAIGYNKLYRDGYWLANFGGGHYKLLKRVDELPVLYTDVKANINGYEIPCYSANSCCVITAEDLRGYGFDVVWDGEARTLNIWRNSEYYNVNPVDIPSGAPASGEYKRAVPTDIKTYFNGKRIPTYAVDGVTMIKPEDIAEDGISFIYDDTKRGLSISVDGLAHY